MAVLLVRRSSQDNSVIPQAGPKASLVSKPVSGLILEGDTPLQQAIADCIRAQCGEDKHGLDAVLIVGLGAKPSCATDRAFS